MTSWSIAANSLPEWKLGTVICVEQPWWLSLIEWFVDRVIGLGCCWLHWAKLPDWFPARRDKCSTELFTLAEWYGDLGAIWHTEVFSPCFDWVQTHPRRKEYNLEIGYDQLKKLFFDRHPDYFRELEEL